MSFYVRLPMKLRSGRSNLAVPLSVWLMNVLFTIRWCILILGPPRLATVYFLRGAGDVRCVVMRIVEMLLVLVG